MAIHTYETVGGAFPLHTDRHRACLHISQCPAADLRERQRMRPRFVVVAQRVVEVEVGEPERTRAATVESDEDDGV
jgi:hypothetical protein